MCAHTESLEFLLPASRGTVNPARNRTGKKEYHERASCCDFSMRVPGSHAVVHRVKFCLEASMVQTIWRSTLIRCNLNDKGSARGSSHRFG